MQGVVAHLFHHQHVLHVVVRMVMAGEGRHARLGRGEGILSHFAKLQHGERAAGAASGNGFEVFFGEVTVHVPAAHDRGDRIVGEGEGDDLVVRPGGGTVDALDLTAGEETKHVEDVAGLVYHPYAGRIVFVELPVETVRIGNAL